MTLGNSVRFIFTRFIYFYTSIIKSISVFCVILQMQHKYFVVPVPHCNGIPQSIPSIFNVTTKFFAVTSHEKKVLVSIGSNTFSR